MEATTAQQYVGLFIRLLAIWPLFLAAESLGVAMELDSDGRPYGSYVIAELALERSRVVVFGDRRRESMKVDQVASNGTMRPRAV